LQNDYFSILGIERNATEQDIRKAYRRLAKKYHPDVNKSANAHEKFIEITEAYEFLIEHGQEYSTEYVNASADEQKQAEYCQSEEYIRFREEARRKAQEQARMRYEAFKRKSEAFQKSGINDIGLLFTIVFRAVAIPITLALFLLPIFLTIVLHDYLLLFIALFTWPFAGGLGWYIRDNRKHYFMPGKFYYAPKVILQMFTATKATGQPCYYCQSHSANSKPYKLELLKLKDIKLKSEGPRQHSMNYINDKALILIPRSKKAFIVHTVDTIVKLLSILTCLVLLDITSLVWRFIIGMFAGGVISTFILLVTNTKSNVTYLWSFGMIFRVCIWLLIIALFSRFSFHPFDVKASEYMNFIVMAIVLFDCVLMQLVNYGFKTYSYKPAIRQYKDADQQFNLGYKVYNDVFVVSVIYPLYRWIFG